jgi:HlyD family secretion protein
MIRQYVLPSAAGLLLLFAILQVVRGQREQPQVQPPIRPMPALFKQSVAGVGLVEAETENISVGSALPGVVTKVFVKVGQEVKANDPLFQLDDRQLRSERKVRRASLAVALAQLTRLEQQPRSEELPPCEAQVHEAEANLASQEDQYKRAQRLYPARSIPQEELVRLEMAYRVAQEQWARAKAQYDLLKAGAWEPDKAVARATVEQARAQLEQTQTDLDRLLVRALVSGEVLQVNVRPGEYVGAPPNQALIVLGNVHQLHVRVDIDEHDIPRFQPGASGRATLRGDPQELFPLRFVRVVPYVIPKKSLTGDNTERVDTRVLQVIYAIDSKGKALYVGQQMDVSIDAGSFTAADAEERRGNAAASLPRRSSASAAVNEPAAPYAMTP